MPESTLIELEDDIDLHINLITSSLSVSCNKLEQIKQETAKNQTLKQVIYYCQNGWPERKRSVNLLIRP